YDLGTTQVKPHGAFYGQTAHSLHVARAVVAAAKTFSTEDQKVAFVGLAGTGLGIDATQTKWFADLDYDATRKLLITKTHKPVSKDEIRKRVTHLLETHEVTTNAESFLLLGGQVTEVSFCCHSDTP
ncbi:hypothetical protein DFH08DRAFT_625617, partial [Mycena albidolilacea]